MSTTIALPPKLVPHMREAMIFELGQASRTIALESALKDPRLDEPLHRFDTARGVLDALGGARPNPPGGPSCRGEGKRACVAHPLSAVDIPQMRYLPTRMAPTRARES